MRKQYCWQVWEETVTIRRELSEAVVSEDKKKRRKIYCE
jgi:hypothetical protein